MGKIASSVDITEEIAGAMITHSSQITINNAVNDGYTDVPVQLQCVECLNQTKGAIDNFKTIIENEANALKDLGQKFGTKDEQLASKLLGGNLSTYGGPD